MKKYIKAIVFVLLLNIVVTFNGKDVFAADESVIMFKGVNATCNVYPKASKANSLTYVNPLFQRDAPLLGNSGNFYKTIVAGVEGWIPKDSPCLKGAQIKKVSQMPNFSFNVGGASLRGLDVSRYQATGNKLYFNSVYNTGYITVNLGYTDLPAGLKNGTVYYSYDGNYFYTNYNTMVANYKNKTRANAVNATRPYYDYYQYVPIRSVSKIQGASFDKRLVQLDNRASQKISQTMKFNTKCKGNTTDFISKYNGYFSNTYAKGGLFVAQQKNYQVNTGALYGIMLNESANGSSNLSRHYNNPFGWGAVDSCPNSATRYSNMTQAIQKYYQNMSGSYANPVNDSGGKGTHLGNKKSGANVRYASDPHWGYKNAFNYRKADELAGNVDKNSYKLGIVNSGKNAVDGTLANEYTHVYASASTSASKPYYYERNGASVIIQGEVGSFYKIQKDSAANSGSVYILKSKVHVANTVNNSTVKPTTPAVKVEYKKEGNKHFVWGLNTSGQLGNGKSANVSAANKINLNTVLPNKKEVIKKVIATDSNIFVLTTAGNVYGSGKNNFGQRAYLSKANVFTKANTLSQPINDITFSKYSLRMQSKKSLNDYFYVGQNGFNAVSNKFNRSTSYPVMVRYSNGKIVASNYYNYSHKKVSGIYFYDANGYSTKTYTYVFDAKTSRTTQRTHYKYSRNVRTYAQRLQYNVNNNRITHKMEWYYNGGKLVTKGSKKACRYSTNYNTNGKASRTYLAYYNTKGKLLKAKIIAVRK